ncbi:acyl CoA:acetate/3-ketoacid CoA transferase [uncultured Microscilla sp.]|uniref:acyl CoA:acetate/3-ketoacid CoA transferase n=1 Tax=uncultured Microscilla sp. TaxID=432653 RepID=UPI0026202AA5|nr:acyl CoA:acetate/3-ketoacid CoA transferase [uncultured Microscilla sp.]
MNRYKIVSAEEAAAVIMDDDTIATGGFVGIGFPEALAIAIENRFKATQSPKNLTLLYAAGQGDGKTRGLNHFSHPGMVKRVIGGHWGLVPTLGKLAIDNQIEAYNFPQGAISHLFRDIAAGKPGTITKVGLHTFVDPRQDGGKINQATSEDLVELIQLRGEEYLFYKAFPINIALLRGTTADEEGNISMEHEALTLESLAIAQAVKNSGGIVIVQVERVTVQHHINPQMVIIPGIMVDSVVVADPAYHHQTFSEVFNPAYTGHITVPKTLIKRLPLDARKVIARRAAMFLKINSVVNLGIGMPEGVASVANEENILDYIIPTVEPGAIGGIPSGGLSFGAVSNAQAIISQPSQFDFYDGGGLNQAFLGMAEVDAAGHVNVSRFGDRIAGAGGFINISQNAKAVYFMGTFTAKSEIIVEDGKLKILKDSHQIKFVDQVGQITFNGEYSQSRGQIVYYITERAVFKLTEEGLELIEIAPGIDLQKDILDKMAFKPLVSNELKTMDERIFLPKPMKIRKDEKVSFEDRILFEQATNTMYINLEGIVIHNHDEVQEIEIALVEQFEQIGKKFKVVVNYDNFHIADEAERAFFEMVKRNDNKYFTSSTRYSTNAFFRRHIGTKFQKINAVLYANSDEAREHL